MKNLYPDCPDCKKKKRVVISTGKLLNLNGMYFSRLLTISKKKGFSVLKKYRLVLEEV